MKLWKFLFVCLFCFLLVGTVLSPIRTEAAEAITVYLDPAAGSDSANGTTEATAVRSYDTAYGLVKAAGSGRIVFLSTLELTEDCLLPDTASDVPVVLTSKTGGEGIASSVNVRFNAPTTLENMTMTLTVDSTFRNICGEGNTLVIGKNVTSVGTGGSYFNLSGGKQTGKCASTDLTVQSGTWQNIYVGTRGYKSGIAGVTGQARLTMTGGSLTGFITPSYDNSATVGSVEIYLSNMSAARIFSAPVKSGTVTGDLRVTFGENVQLSSGAYAGGNGTGSINGTVTFVLDGADTTGWPRISGGGASGFKGSVGASKLLLQSGTMGIVPAGLTSVDVDIPKGKTLTISQCALTADTVRGAGTLAFSGPAKLSAREVMGTVNCAIDGNAFTNHPYITAPAGSGFVFAGVPEDNGTWIIKDLENFQGLVLTAQKGVTVTLYTGFDPDDAKKVEPYAVEGNTRYYPALQGNYYYIASGTGYYKVKQNIYMSPEKAATKTVIDATPGKISGLGWEPSNATVKYYTEEFMKNAVPSDKAMWPEFAELFTTPAFGENRAEHQHTTQSEMEAFLAGLDDANDNMYVYSMGTSRRGQNMPLVIFTRLDLTGKTLEEAAALIVADSEKNGKLTVHNQAHMHGNEQAAGETALGMIRLLDGTYGEGLLDSMNIYVMPRLNPDGAQDNIRYLPTWGNKDPNSDLIQLETVEMQNVVRVMNLLQPHVFIDNHEGNVAVDNDPVTHGCFLVNPSYSTQSNDDFRQLGLTMTRKAFAALEEKGFVYRYIDNIVTSKNMGVGRCYAGSQGILAFLIETPGIYNGCNGYERRVVGGVTCLTTFYDYLNENRETVKATVLAEQQRIKNDGKTFEESDIVVLASEGTEHPELAYQMPTYNGATGEITGMRTLTPKVHDKILRFRVAPTAYVLPAGESWVEAVLTIMDRQGISYTKLPAGSQVRLRQYTGSREAADLTEETAVTFPEGAYVFTMNTQKAEILTAIFEPDMTDTVRTLTSGNGRLSADGKDNHTYIYPENGVFPIYRYEHDLNEAGGIDYICDRLAGDLTGDGQVTDADAIYLLRNTLFPENYPLSGNGDVNCDGQITDADAIYLLRHTLFPENYPLYPKKEDESNPKPVHSTHRLLSSNFVCSIEPGS